jgi:hypothetical protein
MLRKREYIIFIFLFLFPALKFQAQDPQIPQLEKRVDSLEQKVNAHDTYLKKVFGQELPNSRNEVENKAYTGFVISGVKGITLSIGGFVETDLIYDFDAVGDKNSFTTSSIIMNPTPGSGNVTTFSVRPSRLSFKGKNLENSVSALLEFDFAGSNGATLPRLRHAYITFKNLGAGKYWSNFMDSDNYPDILDFEGPNGSLSIRVVQVRYTFKAGKTNKMAFTLEIPGAELTVPDTWISKGVFPDLTASFEHRFWKETSHLRLAGLLHPVTYVNSNGSEQTIIGGGLSFSGCLQTGKLDNINLQVTAGSGFAKYNNDLGGLGYDAFQCKADTNKAATLGQINFFVYYNHWWTARLSSALGCSYVGLSNEHGAYHPNAIKSTSYASTNLIFYPNNNFKLGLEFLYGNRMNMDYKMEEAYRIQFTFFARI